MVSQLVMPAKRKLRLGARRLALDMLSAAASIEGTTQRTLLRPRIHFVYLHDIPPGEESELRAFLSYLSRNHHFVSHAEAVKRLLNGPIDKPYVSFSFDDGFKSNVGAARVLEDFGTVGCFFIPPGFIDTKLGTAEAMRAFGFARGTCEPPMSWRDLEQLKSNGHEIANHTMNHKMLAGLSSQEVVDEINFGAERIRDVLGDCRHFAWPRGRFEHFNGDAASAVYESGHVSCSSAERGSHTVQHQADLRLLCIRRDHEMTSWPQRHRTYFVHRSSKRSNQAMNLFPESWSIAVE